MFGKYMKYSIFYYLKKKQYYIAISNLQDMCMLIIWFAGFFRRF